MTRIAATLSALVLLLSVAFVSCTPAEEAQEESAPQTSESAMDSGDAEAASQGASDSDDMETTSKSVGGGSDSK